MKTIKDIFNINFNNGGVKTLWSILNKYRISKNEKKTFLIKFKKLKLNQEYDSEQESEQEVNYLDSYIGAYSHTYTSSDTTLPSSYTPKIYKKDNNYFISGLFGNGVNPDSESNIDNNATIIYNGTNMIVKGGWVHSKFGRIDQNIILYGTENIIYAQDTINITGSIQSCTISGYKMTKY